MGYLERGDLADVGVATPACQGKIVFPPSSGPKPGPVAGPEPTFATLEVDETPSPKQGPVGSVSIEARGVTVRLGGDMGTDRIAETLSRPRSLRSPGGGCDQAASAGPDDPGERRGRRPAAGLLHPQPSMGTRTGAEFASGRP